MPGDLDFKNNCIKVYENKTRYSKKELKEAFQYLLNLDVKDEEDCFWLASSYHFGFGTKKNFKKSLEWYKKAAAKGCDTSSYNLYVMYRDGQGTSSNLEEAFLWLKKSARLKNPDALADMGYAYFYGKGVHQNKRRAIEYYKKAAKLKVSRALFNLALIYLDGDSVKPDYKKGMQYLKKSYDLGNERSAFLLARIYNGSFSPYIKPNKSLSSKYLKVARKYGIKEKL